MGNDEESTSNIQNKFEHTEGIFFELASEQRLSILFKLEQEKFKLAKLARELDVTMQEVHRNVNRLMESGLIEKDSNGNFSLTTFGSIILKHVSTFAFLSRNKAYFSEHILGETPMKFIHRIGSLERSEHVSGFVAVIELWKHIYKQSSEYIYAILPQIPFELIEAILAKLKSGGIKFSYILPRNALVPKKRIDLLKSSGFRELLQNGIVERRMTDRVGVAVVLSENEATVMFPTLKGVTDMNSLFYGDSIQNGGGLFHEWCLDFYRYCWYNSKSFDENKLIEV